ncbi:MAG: arylsulfatase, partial [Blastopirellula sp.]
MNPSIWPRLFTLHLLAICTPVVAKQPPNVVFVITDDQGYGDLGFTGNPVLKTPHLDILAGESVWLEDFHVAPSCSPTRSSMLTGRWTNRTGVWHTFFARAMMYEDEVTIAEHFQAAGYATGMFGKWHLGDHYPYRPHDRGFDMAYCIRGGATGVTADYWDNDYFDDYHFRNGKATPSTGYSTDVFFAESQRFIKEQVARNKPFFAWIATTAPHKPWVCPPEYSGLYPKESKKAAAFYGMLTNID